MAMQIVLLSLSMTAFLSSSTLASSGNLPSPFSRSTNASWPADIAHLVFDSSWPQFVEKTNRWSRYEAPTFNEVFLPETITDLSRGLEYLTSTDKIWLAKSGGHGYSPTLGVIQDAVMINMDTFDKITMKSSNTVTIGSAITFAELINALSNANRELNVGTCPCVGMMGAMLGGGYGRLQGQHGTISDALRSATVVLWNGTVVEASGAENADLLWGLQGAGHNFGIVAEATLETWPISNGGFHYHADIAIDPDEVGAILDVTNDLVENELDPRLAIMMSFAIDQETFDPLVMVNIDFAGPQEDVQDVVSRYEASSIAIDEQMLPWRDVSFATLSGFVAAACTPGAFHSQRSVQTRTMKKQAFMDLFASLVAFVRENPWANRSSIITETFATQGLQVLGDAYSAFPHRNAFRNGIILDMVYFEEDGAEASNKWARAWRDALGRPEISGYDELHVYMNYAQGDEPLSALYGYDTWRHERLSRLKRAYDPRGYFNGYHAVPARLEDWD